MAVKYFCHHSSKEWYVKSCFHTRLELVETSDWFVTPTEPCRWHQGLEIGSQVEETGQHCAKVEKRSNVPFTAFKSLFTVPNCCLKKCTPKPLLINYVSWGILSALLPFPGYSRCFQCFATIMWAPKKSKLNGRCGTNASRVLLLAATASADILDDAPQPGTQSEQVWPNHQENYKQTDALIWSLATLNSIKETPCSNQI